jgi:hypothetical protein
VKPSEILKLAQRFELSFSRELSDEGRKLWLELFAGVGAEEATAVLDRFARIGGFPPTPQQIAEEARTTVLLFAEVWEELIENASTCDWFDENPPRSLSDPAYALAELLGWSDFRSSNPSDTFYQRQAERRFEELGEMAHRRVAQGLPAFRHMELEPSNAVAELVEGIGQ